MIFKFLIEVDIAKSNFKKKLKKIAYLKTKFIFVNYQNNMNQLPSCIQLYRHILT